MSENEMLVLPSTWNWVCAGEVLKDIQAGKSLSASDRPAFADEWGVLKVSAVSWGTFKPEENKALPKGYVPPASFEVKPGDLLISRANTTQLVGAVVLVQNTRPNLMLSDKTLRLIPYEHLILKQYLQIALAFPNARKHIESNATGTSHSMKNISQDVIRETPIPLPPLSEQRRIAAILARADRLRRLRRYALEISDSYLQAVFVEMFGDLVRNPRGWERARILELGEVQTGNTPSREDAKNYGDYIEWIKSDNIVDGEIGIARSREMLSKQGAKGGRIADAGSSLVVCIAGSATTIGNVGLLDRQVAFNQQINAVTPHKDVDAVFLYGLLLVAKPLVQLSTTLGMKRIITKSKFEELLLIKPPLPLQKHFADIAKRYERLRTQQREALRQAEHLFQTLLHKAFRGELGGGDEVAVDAALAEAPARNGNGAASGEREGELVQARMGLE